MFCENVIASILFYVCVLQRECSYTYCKHDARKRDKIVKKASLSVDMILESHLIMVDRRKATMICAIMLDCRHSLNSIFTQQQVECMSGCPKVFR